MGRGRRFWPSPDVSAFGDQPIRRAATNLGRTPPLPVVNLDVVDGWRADFLLLSRDALKQDIRLRKRNAGFGDSRAPKQLFARNTLATARMAAAASFSVGEAAPPENTGGRRLSWRESDSPSPYQLVNHESGDK
jgi:hypothetical protein